MFQNEELSNILKDIFGDEEEVDAREQEGDDMCDDEGEMKERMAMQMLEDSVCGMKHSVYNVLFSIWKKNRYSSLILRLSVFILFLEMRQ